MLILMYSKVCLCNFSNAVYTQSASRFSIAALSLSDPKLVSQLMTSGDVLCTFVLLDASDSSFGMPTSIRFGVSTELELKARVRVEVGVKVRVRVGVKYSIIELFRIYKNFNPCH